MMTFPMTLCRRMALAWLPMLLVLAVPVTATAEDVEEPVHLLLQWEDTKPEHALQLHGMLLMLHNGEIDLYDYHNPAPPLLSEWLGKGLDHLVSETEPPQEGGAVHAFRQAYPQAVVSWFWQDEFSGQGPQFSGEEINRGHAVVKVDPARHRFLSWLGLLTPSNDAFLGNEDPYQIEIFDENGRFRGPMYLDIDGVQVMDAGLCENTETALPGLDSDWNDRQCQAGEGTVRFHPGLNGSLRNPDGQPRRILGNDNAGSADPVALQYDEIAADFSRPGYRYGRLLIRRLAAGGEASGSWYDPERAGEGFNFQVLEPAEGDWRHRLQVHWYTYAPDGSGRQLWLTGIGDFSTEDAGISGQVLLYSTQGGRFASTDNPELVEASEWGRVEVQFPEGGCGPGLVRYMPEVPGWPTGQYPLYRLSPEIEGLRFVCDPSNAHRVLPE